MDIIAGQSVAYSAGYEHFAQDQVDSSQGESGHYSLLSADMEQMELGDFEGNTVASTASYMTEVAVVMMGSEEPRVIGFVVEIPLRELDDTPDVEGEGLPHSE